MPSQPTTREGLSRRDFARLLAVAGSAPWLAGPDVLWAQPGPVSAAPAGANEAYWTSIREQFVMPKELAVMNAANLCPSSAPVLEAMYQATKDMDRDPSFDNREKLGEGKENTRKIIAEFLGASPDDIVITRNTSEANNIVSLGLELKAGDEIILFSDNHPSNMAAWENRAERYGFTIKKLQIVNPHPGPEYYIDEAKKLITPNTKLISFTQLTNTIGDLMPAKELCALARERGILSMVDGAQSFGLIAVNIAELQPDFFTGSAHKWPCGPKEVGVLYISKNAQPRVWPSIISAGPGAVGISKTHERFGQRDEPAIIALGEALKFQMAIGRQAIEDRSRAMSQSLMEQLSEIDGVLVRTSREPGRSLAVVVFQPGDLDVRKLAQALYEKDHIGCATRGGDRGGLRFSPHFYNLQEEVDRTASAIRKYMKSGVS